MHALIPLTTTVVFLWCAHLFRLAVPFRPLPSRSVPFRSVPYRAAPRVRVRARVQVLQELSPQGLHAVFERFRGILHEGQIDKRVQYTIETLFAVRKSKFSDHPAVPPELDLVERDDQITFEIGLEDKLEKEEMLDIFRMDDK